jgi:hypothetical protein
MSDGLPEKLDACAIVNGHDPHRWTLGRQFLWCPGRSLAAPGLRLWGAQLGSPSYDLDPQAWIEVGSVTDLTRGGAGLVAEANQVRRSGPVYFLAALRRVDDNG